MSSLIGGLLIEGGWINQVSAADPISGTGPWNGGYGRKIAIRQCRLQEQWNERPLFLAGLLGCPTTRRVSFQCQFQFSIWYDANTPIEVAINQGAGTPSFRQRDPFQLVFLAGWRPFQGDFFKAYWVPRGVADIVTPIWDEESEPRQVIGMEVTGHAKSYAFLLPDDGDPNDASTIAGAYRSYLAANGGLV